MDNTAGQDKCITTLNKSLVVSAGAGSGKTFTLTKRIAHASAEGFVTDIDQVLAITFTRAAATELKSRLKAELRAIGFIDQALKVDDAWVSTIHAMCARMLRAHALEMGIDPAFAIIESAKAKELLERAVDEVLDELAADSGSADLDALFSHYAVRAPFGGESVESMVLYLINAASTCAGGFDSLVISNDSETPLMMLDRAEGIVEDMRRLAEGAKDGKSKAGFLDLASAFSNEANALREACAAGKFEGATDAELALAIIEVLAPMKFSKQIGNGFKEAAHEADERFLACQMTLHLMAAQDDLHALVDLATYAYERYVELKHAEGVLDNNDLLTLAARMMEEHSDIAAQYADKFKLIMVDESQDTDQMQVDMIRRLAGPDACRLCTVGDAQQSIYRFRGADVLVYKRHLASVQQADPDAVIMLPDNFRSHGDVLSFVDRVFEQPGMFGGSFMSLKPGRHEDKVERPYRGADPRIEVQVTTHPSSGGANSDETIAVAAQRIAARFAQLVHEGHAAGDMVILLGRMTKSEVYAQALREVGLSCVITGGSVFAASPEVALVKALLHIIANPRDTQALYEVLAGPLFALSADDFLVLATAGESGNSGFAGSTSGNSPQRRDLDMGMSALAAQLADSMLENVSPELVCAVRVLAEARAAAGKRSVARLLEQIIVDSGLVTRLEEHGAEGLASAGNVYKALRIVDDLERRHAYGPVQLMRAFEETIESGKEGPGALSSTGGDFVRIMTVHSSKGLEFPIVAVADIRTASTSIPKLFVRQVDGSLLVSLDAGTQAGKLGKEPGEIRKVLSLQVGEEGDEDELLAIAGQNSNLLARRAALAEAERQGDAEEAKRLLYVALTRAEEALVVSIVDTMPNDVDSRYAPSGVLGGIVGALDKKGQGFAPGVMHYEYGGTEPAIVEHVHLPEKGDGVAYLQAAAANAGGRKAVTYPFAIPAPCGQVRVSRVNYRPARTGVFSYSSIAEAAHEGDVLSQLAQQFFCGADEAAIDVPLLGDTGWQQVSNQVFWANSETVFDEDDGSWAYAGESTADDDRATDLGTAFHRLAQYAVVARAEDSRELVMPPVQRIDAQARACRLDGQQHQRLNAALERWFASDIAAQMAAYDDLRAEVPFFLALPNDVGSQVFLDGEIDLLALDGAGRAFVVDYKTGGHADETTEQLSEKHVLQASCYALSLLRQGIDEVQATFVRVEQPRANEPDVPQCVRYHFTADDEPILEKAIAQAYQLATR